MEVESHIECNNGITRLTVKELAWETMLHAFILLAWVNIFEAHVTWILVMRTTDYYKTNII